MMNPSPPPKSTDPEFTAVSNLLAALTNPDAATRQLALYATKAKENADGAAQLQAAQEQHVANVKVANDALAAAKATHASASLKRQTELDVAAAALEQREKSLDKRESELDSRAKVLDDRHAAITKREAAFVQAQRLMAI